MQPATALGMHGVVGGVSLFALVFIYISAESDILPFSDWDNHFTCA